MTAEQPHPRRLDDTEMDTWLPVIRFVQLLPQVLDRTLKEEVGLNHARYAILVTLAGRGEGAVTMTELARIAGLSRSRLSHALDSSSRSEAGSSVLVWRRQAHPLGRPDSAGREMLRTAAPVHVEQVRELVLDPLTAEEREQLRAILGKLLPGVTAAL